MISLTNPRRFYRIEKTPDSAAWGIFNEWRQRHNEVREQHWAFARSKGAEGYFPGSDDNVGNGISIYGLIFKAGPGAGLPKGWKRKQISTRADMTGKLVGWPDQRTAIGKAAMAEIKALPLLPSTCKACDAIGFPHALMYRGKDTQQGTISLGFFETLIVGHIGDTFYASLPDEAAQRAELESDGYTVEGSPWSPPPGMVEILKEEMDLDYAEIVKGANQ